jgi:hypothetical protein
MMETAHSTLFALKALPLAALAALGGDLEIRSGAARDDLDLRNAQLRLQWKQPVRSIELRLGLDGTGWSVPALSGIQETNRLDAGWDAEASKSLGPATLALGTGMASFARLSSWALTGSVAYTPAPGWKIELSPKSRELPGWASVDVRATNVSGRLDWGGQRTWAGAGASWEHRSPGAPPAGSLPLALPDNQVLSAWAWGTRQVAGGILLGMSASWADAEHWTRVATGKRNDTLLWLDVPYRSPHDEVSVDAVAKLRWRSIRFEVDWPVWSTSRLRVESPWIADSPWSYTLDHVGLAQLRTGLTGRTGNLLLEIEAFAKSRPYASAAWFTDRAWNQFGLETRIALPIAPKGKDTP